jgi:hypothetical protein
MKFSTVAERKLDCDAPGAGFGFVSELKSKARPKFLGSWGVLTRAFSQNLSGSMT